MTTIWLTAIIVLVALCVALMVLSVRQDRKVDLLSRRARYFEAEAYENELDAKILEELFVAATKERDNALASIELLIKEVERVRPPIEDKNPLGIP